VVLIPVALGMLVRWRALAFAARAERPMKAFSALVLALFALIAIVKEWEALRSSFMLIGPAVVLFNVASLLSGYYVSRMAGLDKPMATAISYEIGIHNSTLAMFIALSVLNDFQLALPAALYSVSMYITATAFRHAGAGAAPLATGKAGVAVNAALPCAGTARMTSWYQRAYRKDWP
jgi:BASS family bile acid:Na+ symporter